MANFGSLIRLMARVGTTNSAKYVSMLQPTITKSSIKNSINLRRCLSTSSPYNDAPKTFATPTSRATADTDDSETEVIHGYGEYFSEAAIEENNLSEDLVKIFDLNNASQKERTKHVLAQLAKEWQLHDRDTGSTPVLVALTTGKIQRLQAHCIANPKDLHSRRGLVAMVEQRRKALQYLKRKDFPRYNEVISKLNIRPVVGMR